MDRQYEVQVYGKGGGVMKRYEMMSPLNAEILAEAELRFHEEHDPQVGSVGVWAKDRSSHGSASRV